MKKSIAFILLIGAISFMGFSKTTSDLRQNSNHSELVPLDVVNSPIINVGLVFEFATQSNEVGLNTETSIFNQNHFIISSINVIPLIDNIGCDELSVNRGVLMNKKNYTLTSNAIVNKNKKNPRDGLTC